MDRTTSFYICDAKHIIEPWAEIFEWFESSILEWGIPMQFCGYDGTTQGGRIFIPVFVD
ncbi:MAG: hypothetical protein ACI9FB_000803 [Candidatus Azotimanducaceae bacterium]